MIFLLFYAPLVINGYFTAAQDVTMYSSSLAPVAPAHNLQHVLQKSYEMSKHSHRVIIEATADAIAKWYSINFLKNSSFLNCCVSLQIEFNITNKNISVNYATKESWSSNEKRYDLIVKNGETFSIEIYDNKDSYKIHIVNLNSSKSLSFNYASGYPKSEAKHLAIYGDVKVNNVVWYYYDQNPVLYAAPLSENFQAFIVHVHSFSKKNARFSINLKHSYLPDQSDIPLYLVFRLSANKETEIAANSFANGLWNPHEKRIRSRSKLGEAISVRILNNNYEYQINVNNKVTFNFTSQTPVCSAKHLMVLGEARFSYIFWYKYGNQNLIFDNPLKNGFPKGSAIAIAGSLPAKQKYSGMFMINFQSDEDTALHINPRFSDSYMVLNYMKRSTFLPGTQILHNIHFKAGDQLLIQVLNSKKEFVITINSLNYTYPHHLPNAKIDRLQIFGDFILSNVMI